VSDARHVGRAREARQAPTLVRPLRAALRVPAGVLAAALAVGLVASGAPAPVAAQGSGASARGAAPELRPAGHVLYDTALYAGLRYRMVGPSRGGRADAVAGVPGHPETFYFGSAGGGVWKTTDAGVTWRNV